MPNRTPKNLPTRALDTTNALAYPDLSLFEGTTHTRVRCKVCLRSGPVEDIWVLSCLAGHPKECEAKGCTRVFTTLALLARHLRAKHPELLVTDETKAERRKRLKNEHRERLREAGIGRDGSGYSNAA